MSWQRYYHLDRGAEIFRSNCATCHGPGAGWTGPDGAINAHGAVYEGSIPGAFGDRKPPSAAYATQSPVLSVDKKGLFVGGNFWDGRATGEILGSPAAEQAKGPFLNPVEQALPSAAELVARVCAASYGDLFRELWGAGVCDPANVAMAYDDIGYSVAAYEASPEVNAFSSKFDSFKLGLVKITKEEQLGYALFRCKAKCAKCHIANGLKPLFTDYTFDNLGTPKNRSFGFEVPRNKKKGLCRLHESVCQSLETFSHIKRLHHGAHRNLHCVLLIEVHLLDLHFLHTVPVTPFLRTTFAQMARVAPFRS